MQSEQLSRLVIDALDDGKGIDIVSLDVRSLTDVTDYMIIASGRSNRHVNALAENVVVTAKKSGHRPMGVEGQRTGEWVLVDLCDVLVHVMQPDTRDLYQLEKLWGGRDAAVATGRTHTSG